MSNQVSGKPTISKLYFGILLLFSAVVLIVSAFNFSFSSVNRELIVLLMITAFLSPHIRIQLPRTKIHLTVSEILIFYTLLFYGGEIAIFIAAFESLCTSIAFRRRGLIKTNQTILFNVTGATVSTFFTALVLKLLFTSPGNFISEVSIVEFGSMMILLGLVQFFGNSITVSVREALRHETPFKIFWEVWFKYCGNVLVMFIASALVSGLLIKARNQFNSLLFLIAFGVFSLVYLTYRRYVNEVKATSAKAEQSERLRAEQAEHHVEELQHHIAEQNRISQALRDSKEKFRHAAFHDALTDLPNRNLFMETLKFALEKSRHNHKFKFAVLFLDINRFKTINDSLGHSMGDRLIMHVAKRLVGAVRNNDLVARFSGDEFAFILNDINSVEDATLFAGRIKDKIAEPFSLLGKQVFTSFSIGIAVGSAEYELAEDILRDADIAMYHAKDGEKDYVLFDKNMHTRAVKRLQLETDLRTAIERDELKMFYQPIIDLNSMNVFGFESLIRWNHPIRGLVPPNDFIPVSEQTGFIIPLTLWILRTSCHQMVEWQRKYPSKKDLVVSINISGKHFAQKNLVEQIQSILIETGIAPACVKLELTESAMMENTENVITMLKQIRDLGVKLSIDDFGTGYSSLSYLHRFPINTLKVDRSFVSAMEDGSENGEIVRTVIALAKTLRLDVIAEGIETIHQLHQLRILGCEYGQGYLFSRPVPADEAEKLIEDKSRFESSLIHGILPIPTVEVSNLKLPKVITH